MGKVHLFLFLLSILSSLSSKADDRFGAIGRYSIETNYQFGRIIPHNKKFGPKITGYTHAAEVTCYQQTLGEKAWQRKHRYPELGGSFVFMHNADQQAFGNVYLVLA